MIGNIYLMKGVEFVQGSLNVYFANDTPDAKLTGRRKLSTKSDSFFLLFQTELNFDTLFPHGRKWTTTRSAHCAGENENAVWEI
jgi:hypothetical protein